MTLRFAIWLLIIVFVVFTIYAILKNSEHSKILAILSTLLTFLTFSATWIVPENILSKNVFSILKSDDLFSTQAVSLYIGEMHNLSNELSLDSLAEWESSNLQTVSIDDDGNAIALAEGIAEISALTENNQILAKWQITVISPGIKLSQSTIEMYLGDVSSINTTTYPNNLNVTWNSKDTSIVTVDSLGKIFAVSCGITTLSATIEYAGKTYFQNCQVIVSTPSIEFVNHTLNLNRGDSTQLVTNVYPQNQNAILSLSDTSIVTVGDEGNTITAIRNGTVTITATIFYNGVEYHDTCTIVVDSVPTEISSIYRMTTLHGGFYTQEGVTDIYGEKWNGTAYYASLSGFNGFEDGHSSERYYTKGQYDLLYGTIVLPSDQYNTNYTAYLKVYGDNQLIYTSPPISGAFVPLDFEVDISGVSELEIELGGHWSILDTECRPVIVGVCVK